MKDSITVAELDAMSDEEFASLFPGGPAMAGMIVALGKQQASHNAPLPEAPSMEASHVPASA